MTPIEQVRNKVIEHIELGFGLRPLQELTGVKRQALSAFAKGETVTLSAEDLAAISALPDPELTATPVQVRALRKALRKVKYPDDLIDEWLEGPVSWKQLEFLYQETGVDVGPQGRVLSVAIPPAVRDDAQAFAETLRATFETA